MTGDVRSPNAVPLAELQRRLTVMAGLGYDPRTMVERVIDRGALSERVGYQLIDALHQHH